MFLVDVEAGPGFGNPFDQRKTRSTIRNFRFSILMIFTNFEKQNRLKSNNSDQD